MLALHKSRPLHIKLLHLGSGAFQGWVERFCCRLCSGSLWVLYASSTRVLQSFRVQGCFCKGRGKGIRVLRCRVLALGCEVPGSQFFGHSIAQCRQQRLEVEARAAGCRVWIRFFRCPALDDLLCVYASKLRRLVHRRLLEHIARLSIPEAKP